MMRIDVVVLHQPGERRPGTVEVHFLDSPRLDRVNLEQPFDIGGHLLIDELEQPAAGRIKAVVEVENPVADVGEAGVHSGTVPSDFSTLSKLKGFGNHNARL